MNRGGDFFKLGLFVIGGVVLLFVVLFALGAGKLFQRTYQMETYLNESVNGLEVGTAVKFRGVRVGSVSEIGFVAQKYGQKANGYRYVYVLCTLDKDLFGTMGAGSAKEQAAAEVARGLRARTISQGLTGQQFLGLDYVDPGRYQPLPIDWEPASIYVPAAPSTLSQVEQAVLGISNTLTGLEEAQLPEAVKSFRRFADSASTFLEGADAKELGGRLSATLEETRRLLSRINHLLANRLRRPSSRTPPARWRACAQWWKGPGRTRCCWCATHGRQQPASRCRPSPWKSFWPTRRPASNWTPCPAPCSRRGRPSPNCAPRQSA
jgi:paraquat-inducible protein B